jgi:photosystem II stability/assembly factor-like uncharacterized protein
MMASSRLRFSIPVGLALALVAAAPVLTLPMQGGAAVAPVDPSLWQDLRWRSVGPQRGGRVTAVAGVPTQPDVFYLGASGGGIWKTVNAGITWAPVSDGQIETGSIGSLEVAPSNPGIVWAGTGSAAIRSNVILGRGIYKSADAGKTWHRMGLREAGQIGAVAIHPSRPDTVWAAALGSPYGPGPERGVYKTSDGGASWRRVLFVNEETGARVVVVDPVNPDVLYAGMHRAFRKGWDIVSGGPASEGGIYRSADGGETWQKLSTGLPSTLTGRIDLALFPGDPRILYAMVEAPGAEGGLYRTDDAGASWRLVNNDDRLRRRPFYFHYVDVNPRDADEVWVGEVALRRSTDGGRTFTVVPTPHGDHHGLWFNPGDPRVAILATDGGATVTRDGGRSWSSVLGQTTGEFYMVAVDEQFPYRLYGPQQDNSTVIVPSLPPVWWRADRPEQLWRQGPGCETGQIQPRPDGQVVYGVCKGEFGRYALATGQEQHFWLDPQDRYGHHPDDIRYRLPRQSVILVSPHDPGVVYHASHLLHRTQDEGRTWTVISPDLTAHEPDKQIVPGTPITRDVTGEEVYSSIYAMAESRRDRGVLWVGANDGPVYLSRDGGANWLNVTPPGVEPGGRVQTIEDSPHRSGAAYVAIYRYLREHDLRPFILATDDFGATWRRLTTGDNGIPADHPTRVVREDPDVPGLLYAGTEFGVFVSFDNGGRWDGLQLNLPATPVTDIRVHRGDLVIATMGRGFWILDDVGPLRAIARGAREAGRARLIEPAPAYRQHYAAQAGRADEPEYPVPVARLDYVLPRDGATVELEIAGADGSVVRTLSSAQAAATGEEASMRAPDRQRRPDPVPARAGHNRARWDLRASGPWTAGEERAGGGPLVPPGTYEARVRIDGQVHRAPVEVRADPRVLASGVTVADLEQQYALQCRVRDAIGEARQLAARLGRVAGGDGEAAAREAASRLRARLETAGGPYPQPMLIDQLGNLQRMLAGADQAPGASATERFEELRGALDAVQREAASLR